MSNQELIHFQDYLQFIYIVIMILGFLLTVFLLLGVNKIFIIGNLKKYRSNEPGLAELLYAASEPVNGIIVQKNGAMMAAFSYKGQDSASLTNSDLNYTKKTLNNLFSRLESGWMFHIDSVRTKVPQYIDRSRSFFPDKVSAAIDEERRNYFMSLGNSYESGFILTVTWLPPSVAKNKAVKFFIDNGVKKRLSPRQETEFLLKQFEEKVAMLKNQLEVIFPHVERLKTEPFVQDDGSIVYRDYFLSWLYFALTGISQPIIRPETPVYLDQILAAQNFKNSLLPKIGDKYIRVIAIENLPSRTFPGMIGILSDFGCEYRWSTRFIFLDKNEATAQMKKYRRMWSQKQRGFFAQLFDNPHARVNQDAVEMTEECDLVLSDISKGEVSFGFFTQNLILMDEDLDQLERNVKHAMQNILALGLTARIEKINVTEAFFGSLPGHGHENIRRPIISTLNLPDLIPLSTPWIGSANNPNVEMYPENAPCLMQCVTGASLNTVFRLNLHVGDLGHTLILGPTGAGKSTLLCTLVAQARRYQGMSIFAFDKGKSMYALCMACGGSHYTPGEEFGPSFCPLGSIENKEDLAWASDWLQSIVTLNNVQVTPEITNAINDALKELYRQHQLTPDYLMSISSFCQIVANEDVRDVLLQYTSVNAQGTLIDAMSDSMSLSDFTVVEIESLLNLGEKYSLPVLLYLFHKIEKSLKGQPAMLVLDEAWIMLSNKVFRNKIVEWLKVMRKANCSVILATQELADAQNSGILSTLLSQTATKIFLPNKYATRETENKLYTSFGLNHRQIMTIAEGIPKREYFIYSGTDSRMVQLALGKFTLAFVGVSSKDDVKLVHDLVEQFGDKWVDEYLKIRNLRYPDTLVLN